MTRSLPHVIVAACVLAACRGAEAPAPTPPQPTAPETVAPVVEERRAPAVRADGTAIGELERSSFDAFGLPVPRGTTMVESAEGARHFRTRASLDELIGFFDANTPGGVTVEYFERGVRLVPRDADGRVVFAYYDQTPAVFTLSYLDTEGHYARRAAASTSAGSGTDRQGSAPSGGPQEAPGTGDRIVPAGPPAVGRGSAAEQAQFLREQMGSTVSSGDRAAQIPAPLASPVVGGGYSEDSAGRSYRPPLRFVRGVREPRQNPDAMF